MTISYLPITNPTLVFLVVLLVILLAPIVMGKLRIPHIIGMVLAGVVLGQFGLNILVRDNSFELFGKVGLYYIMFLASLELEMEGLKKNKYRILFFGMLTFAVPLILVYLSCAYILQFSHQTSLLLGCIMSSNTLIAYPIVSRYGLQRKPSVMLSVGATMISLFLALILLAGIVSSFNTEQNSWFWSLLMLKFVAYCAAIIIVIPRLTRWFLRRYSDAVMQYVFIMAMLFMSAALSEAVGFEGIFGAFFAGLILNRYIPSVSPLMNRIEFIGNALFIPYFLIGVGMLINLKTLFDDGGVLLILLVITLVGTFGKWFAATISCHLFKMFSSSGSMMFGLTAAHAAGAIAMVMVGLKLETAHGEYLVNNEILNGVVLMILVTCVVSSLLTEHSAQKITLRDQQMPSVDTVSADDEHILIPVKYPNYADQLVNLGILMKNRKLSKPLTALNVVYEDEDMRINQERGKRLLEQVTRYAAGSDVPVQSQVRIAVNIANGIKHAFQEFHASEIIIGMHTHTEVSKKFWGQFHQSLINGLNCQIVMARLMQPLNTLRRIVVAVPSRAQFEPGFYRWLERLLRMVSQLDCRVQFYGRHDTLVLIRQYVQKHHTDVRAQYEEMEHWNEMPKLASTIADDHMFVVVAARKGTVSYKNALDRLAEEIRLYFSGKTLMIIFPDQYANVDGNMTYSQSQHQEDRSAYEVLGGWLKNTIEKTKKQ